jgi:hypothetical protein
MHNFDSHDDHKKPWAREVLIRLRRMVSRLRGRELDSACCEVRHLSTARVEKVLAQVGSREVTPGGQAKKRYVITDSHHPSGRYRFEDVPASDDEDDTPPQSPPPSAETDDSEKPYPPNTELGKLSGARDSLFNTADVLRKVADQMKDNVEAQRRVNEKLAELRDRIRQATERMKRPRVNIDLMKSNAERPGTSDGLRDDGPSDGTPPEGPFRGDKPNISLPEGGFMRYHEYVELTGLAEFEKFSKLGPINDDDLDRLRRRDWWLTEE